MSSDETIIFILEEDCKIVVFTIVRDPQAGPVAQMSDENEIRQGKMSELSFSHFLCF